MNREQLAEVLRAASRIVDERPIVLGSQAILGAYDDSVLPPAATVSMEVDVAPLAAVGFAVVPYGPLRYAALVAVPLAALLLPGRGDRGPTLVAVLAGRIRAAHLAALLPAALVASLVYALAWQAAPDDATLTAVRELHVLGQVVAGGGLLTWALWRAVRDGRHRTGQLIRSVS